MQQSQFSILQKKIPHGLVFSTQFRNNQLHFVQSVSTVIEKLEKFVIDCSLQFFIVQIFCHSVSCGSLSDTHMSFKLYVLVSTTILRFGSASLWHRAVKSDCTKLLNYFLRNHWSNRWLFVHTSRKIKRNKTEGWWVFHSMNESLM